MTVAEFSTSGAQAMPMSSFASKRRALAIHCITVVLLTCASLLVYHLLYYKGIRSSDGANYATIARNFAEGRGLVSSVIQPGLMTVVPSSQAGQAFVVQAPLWPIVLGGWFRLFGASTIALEALAGLLIVIATLECWLLAYLLSGKPIAGYLGIALMLANPYVIGHSMAGSNVAMQSAILGGLFLLMYLPLSWRSAVATGILMGLGIVTRENTIFVLPAVAVCWYVRLRSKEGSGRVLGLNRQAVIRFVSVLAVVLVITWTAESLETARKARAIGSIDAPVARLTSLYDTPVGNSGWYFIYDHPMLHIDPRAYFKEHPDVLVNKIIYEIRVLFIRQTLPAIMSYTPLFIPLILPWLFATTAARLVAWGLLIVSAVQVAVSSLSIMNFVYFIAFLPVICSLVAVSVTALLGYFDRVPLRKPGVSGVVRILLATYAMAPLVVNIGSMAKGVPVLTGDYEAITPAQERQFTAFILDNTSPSSVIASGSSALMAWDTRRTIIEYSANPDYHISDSPMWHLIDRQIRIDAILLSSIVGETADMPMLPGFVLKRSLETADLQAWLFARNG